MCNPSNANGPYEQSASIAWKSTGASAVPVERAHRCSQPPFLSQVFQWQRQAVSEEFLHLWAPCIACTTASRLIYLLKIKTSKCLQSSNNARTPCDGCWIILVVEGNNWRRLMMMLLVPRSNWSNWSWCCCFQPGWQKCCWIHAVIVINLLFYNSEASDFNRIIN